MDYLDDVIPMFISESRGLLEEMESSLLALQIDPNDPEAMDAVFRAAHTIKGSAGIFELEDIVSFTHIAETVLDKARSKMISMTEELISLFFECSDHISHLLDLQARNEDLGDDARAYGATLVIKLNTFLSEDDSTSHPEINVSEFQETQEQNNADITEARLDSSTENESEEWHISIRFDKCVLQNGMDPLSFIRYLNTLGEITYMMVIDDELPELEGLNPEYCYFGYEIRFKGKVSKEKIESVFEFVRDDCSLRILPPGSLLQDYNKLMDEVIHEDKDELYDEVSWKRKRDRLGDILISCGAITQSELNESLKLQEQKIDAHEPAFLGDVLVEEKVVRKEVVEVALDKQKNLRKSSTKEVQYVRVQADKLDSLINLVGELVIGSASISNLARKSRDTVMLEAVSGVSDLIEEIRDDAMSLRMVEIGETFSRVRRIVRSASRDLAKDIDLIVRGADTELDKSVVEKINDPLTHLIRNSVDHGIEEPSLRKERGKPEKGTLTLNAYHESGSIVIEVSDDGGGLNRDKILSKAKEKGLVDRSSQLSDEEVWKLIFQPGFSTVDQVSNLSGRGVGMDVVRKNIEQLRGTIEIESETDIGSTFRIRLPLTLAIIDGFLMTIGDVQYVVPLDMVVQCVELKSDTVEKSNDRDYLNLSGKVLPLVKLREYFESSGRKSRRQNVVVINAAGRKVGLVVDELQGELQAVIKPMGSVFSHLRGVAGSTILGSGEVALVLDVMTLIDDVEQQENFLLAKTG